MRIGRAPVSNIPSSNRPSPKFGSQFQGTQDYAKPKSNYSKTMNILSESKCSFRSNRSTPHMIFTAKLIQTTCKTYSTSMQRKVNSMIACLSGYCQSIWISGQRKHVEISFVKFQILEWEINIKHSQELKNSVCRSLLFVFVHL